jgi:hypothetical protein
MAPRFNHPHEHHTWLCCALAFVVETGCRATCRCHMPCLVSIVGAIGIDGLACGSPTPSPGPRQTRCCIRSAWGCLCVCIYTLTYIYIHIFIYIYAYIYTNFMIFIILVSIVRHPCVHQCIDIVQEAVHTYIHTYIHVGIRSHFCSIVH